MTSADSLLSMVLQGGGDQGWEEEEPGFFQNPLSPSKGSVKDSLEVARQETMNGHGAPRPPPQARERPEE